MLEVSTKKISLKSDTERGKYARFSRLVPFFRVLASTVKWIAYPDVDGHLLFYIYYQ